MYPQSVIDASTSNHSLHSSEKSGVYTWARDGSQGSPLIIGAVHCALTLFSESVTIHTVPVKTRKDLTFVELPKSILSKLVRKVGLVNPFDGKFENLENSLPPERDVIAIVVNDIPSFPICSYTAPPENVSEIESLCTSVAGLSYGSMVTNKHGMVSVQPGALPYTGTATFVLDSGEPGDSGCMLHFKRDDQENTNSTWSPGAVFRGLSPANAHSPYLTRRGIATIIPPASKFDYLKVVDVLALHPNAKISCRVGTKDKEFNCEVESEPTLVNTGAVKLVSPRGGCKYGVFVKNEKPIKFIGEKDWATMNGSMLLPDAPSTRKRSFDEVM